MDFKSKSIKIKAAVFIVFTSFTEAAFGFYIGRIVDAISIGDKNIFIRRLVLTFGIIVINIIFSVLGRSNIYRDACAKAEKLKNKVYFKELHNDRQQDVDIANFTSKIDLVFTDDFLNRWLIFEGVFIFIFASLAVITINWVMFFVAVIVSIVPMLVPNLVKGCVQKATSIYSQGSTEYVDKVNDTLQGRLEILRYRVVDRFLKNHEIANNKFEFKRYKARFANYNASTITGAVGQSTFLIVFLVGGFLSFNKLISVGGVIGVIQLMNNIVRPIVSIASYKSEINACAPVLRELNKEMQLNDNYSELIQEQKNKNNVILIRDLVYSYPKTETRVINKFTYRFTKGKKYLIKGDSGSGKTTLAKLLAGELKPESGEILIFSKPIEVIKPEQLLQIVSYVDQKSYVFKDTVFNNIDFYRGLPIDKVVETMQNLNISDIKYEKMIDDANGISGGQKTRLCLARAVMELPDVLIVDEPTAALDEKNTSLVMRFLCSLPITVLVISHHVNDEIISMFDDVIILGKEKGEYDENNLSHNFA